MDDDKLFSPLMIKNVSFKNRIGVAPMTRVSFPGDSIPRKDVLDFLARRAQNDVSLVYTEAIVTDIRESKPLKPKTGQEADAAYTGEALP